MRFPRLNSAPEPEFTLKLEAILLKVNFQGNFRFSGSKFREMEKRSVESVEKGRRLFHPSHSQSDDGDDEEIRNHQ